MNLRNQQRFIRLLVEEVVVDERNASLRIRLRDLDQFALETVEVSA